MVAGGENSIQRRLRAKSPIGDLGARGERSSKGRNKSKGPKIFQQKALRIADQRQLLI